MLMNLPMLIQIWSFLKTDFVNVEIQEKMMMSWWKYLIRYLMSLFAMDQ